MLQKISDFFIKHKLVNKETMMTGLLLVGLFIITDSIDWYNLSKSAMREFDLWFFVIVIAFLYKDKPYPEKWTFIAFWLAMLTVIIVIALNSYFYS